MQKIGAFKIRGALNALLALKEQGRLPKHVVAYSSGNHAQAVALAGRMLGVATTVVMPEFVSSIKQQATRGYGADLRLTKTRQQAEQLAQELAQELDAYFLHTSADDLVIAGQGTCVREALEDGATPDAIFATCGGGGLVSGAWLAAQAEAPQAKVFAAEPLMANDVAQSLRAGHIVGFDDTPMTIADGARTLRVTEKTFAYLQRLDGVLEAQEDEIIYWTQWLTHLLKVTVEPTAALAMAACAQWLAGQKSPQRALVVLSGGNVDAQMQRTIWAKSRLEQICTLEPKL
jgi:threonine dehydratase